MQTHYPLSKEACADPRKFIRFETAYVLLYYVPWEFVFRGVLFFPLVPPASFPPWPCRRSLRRCSISAIRDGNFAALGAGFVFGLIAWCTGSILYLILIHAAIGIATDAFLFPKVRPAGAFERRENPGHRRDRICRICAFSPAY